jgi:hypothetical protein
MCARIVADIMIRPHLVDLHGLYSYGVNILGESSGNI